MLHPGKNFFAGTGEADRRMKKGRTVLPEQKKQRPGKYVPGRVLISKP